MLKAPVFTSLTLEQKQLVTAKLNEAVELLMQVQGLVYDVNLDSSIGEAVDVIQEAWQHLYPEAYEQQD